MKREIGGSKKVRRQLGKESENFTLQGGVKILKVRYSEGERRAESDRNQGKQHACTRSHVREKKPGNRMGQRENFWGANQA